jgi:hypothetical protein
MILTAKLCAKISEKISLDLNEHMNFPWVKMSRCNGKEIQYVIMLSLSMMESERNEEEKFERTIPAIFTQRGGET